VFKRIAIVLGIALICLWFISLENTIVPEKIINTVVSVNGSSGVVVHSDEERTLVLTAFHVIRSQGSGSMVIETGYDEHARMRRVKFHPVLFTYGLSAMDLAIIEIQPGHIMKYAKIAEVYPALGEDIYIAANPANRYRSLKKGIVSSKIRRVEDVQVWEVSGGLIFGSSGGGAFTDDGKLFGIASMVQPFNTNSCFGEGNEQECVWIPIPYMGYVIPPKFVRMLLLLSPYAHHFSYLL